jgi:hypothetical protein
LLAARTFSYNSLAAPTHAVFDLPDLYLLDGRRRLQVVLHVPAQILLFGRRERKRDLCLTLDVRLAGALQGQPDLVLLAGRLLANLKYGLFCHDRVP